MITISIDTAKVDKGRLKQASNGKTYLDLVLFESPNSEYGDYIVKQSATKEEREKKVQLPILGNGKNWNKGEAGRSRQSAAAHHQESNEPPF